MNKLSEHFPELFFNILFFILGLIVLIESFRLGFISVNHQGPGLFSFFAGGLIVVSEAIIIFSTISQKNIQKIPVFFNKKSIKTITTMVFIFSCWIVIMPYLGYILITFIAAFSFAKILGLEGWAKPFFISAGTSFSVYILFDWFLYLDLPRGIFFKG